MMDAPKSGFALTTCSVIHTDTRQFRVEVIAVKSHNEVRVRQAAEKPHRVQSIAVID